MQQEVIQNEQGGSADFLHPFLVLGVVRSFKGYHHLQQGLTMVVLYLVVVTCGNANGLGQIGLAAVGGTQNTYIQTGFNKVQGRQRSGNAAG